MPYEGKALIALKAPDIVVTAGYEIINADNAMAFLQKPAA